ncbi:MAG: glycosyltransferase family 4 protein [Desulfomonile tiedjei]|nr:glycosyltransferase family 4 protein [Desulfomonile tiedjei]
MPRPDPPKSPSRILRLPVAPRSVYIAFEVFPRPKGASSHIAAMVTALAEHHAPVLLLCLGYADMPSLQIEGSVLVLRHKVHLPNLLRRAEEFGEFVHRTLSGLSATPELCVFRDPWGGRPAVGISGRVATVFEVNGLPSWELSYTHPALKENPALMAKLGDLERYCLRTCDTIVTVSDVTSMALRDLGIGAEKIRVVANSASAAFFQASGDECPLESLSEGRWFGYFGSLHPWQGIEILLQAWSMVAPAWPEVRLLIIHSGQRRALPSLRKSVRTYGLTDRVCVQAPLSPERLAAVIARLEFTVAPLTETFRNTVQGCCPLKIVESMAAGTPVLASNLRVTRPLVDHGITGWLVRPDDARAWALAIRRALENPCFTSQMGTAARRTAEKRFTRKVMFERLKHAFQLARTVAMQQRAASHIDAAD